MPEFDYEALNLQSMRVRGTLPAPSRPQALTLLKNEGLAVVSLTLHRPSLFSTRSSRRPNLRELGLFSRKVGTLLERGVPIIMALRMMVDTTNNAQLRAATEGVLESIVSRSEDVSAAFRHSPAVFGDQYVAIVSMGETSGTLPTVFLELGKNLRDRANLVAAVRGGLVYPAIMVSAALVVTLIMLVTVVPTMSGLLAQTGGQLPALTQAVVGTAYFLRDNAPWLLSGLGLGGFLARRYYRSKEGRLKIDTLLLRLPIFGRLIRLANVAQFCSSLAMGLRSGVPINEALPQSRRTVSNAAYSAALLNVENLIMTSALPVSSAFGHHKDLFEADMRGMIEVGNETGGLDRMFAEVGEMYQEEVMQSAGDIAKAVEPVVIIVVGLLIAVIIVALFLPLVALTGQILSNK